MNIILFKLNFIKKKLNYYLSIIYESNNSIRIKIGNYKSYPCIKILVDSNSDIAIL